MNHTVQKMLISALLLGSGTCMADADMRQVIDTRVAPLMQQQGIPGLSIAVVNKGKAQYFNYGVANKDTQQPVTEDTLFEIGSVSKTFTATLGGYAQATGKLKLSDKASQHLPALAGSAFDQISLLQLATYTPGGLPLQFPDAADSAENMLGYFQHWQPTYAPGAQRLYSNPSIGLFGYLSAQSLGQPYNVAMEKTLLPKLGLSNTHVSVPADKSGQYAQGYDKLQKPVRVGPGALDSEAYGIKTSAQDLAHYVMLNMHPQPQLDAFYRFADELLGAGFQPADARARFTEGRQHDDRNTCRGFVALQVAGHLVAVHARHHDVQQDQVGRPLGHDLQRFFTAARTQGLVALVLQQGFQ